MRRKFEYFMDMSIKDLHEELITMVQGDLWDGMVSKGLQTEIDAANKAWDEKMKSLDESQKTEQGIEAVEDIYQLLMKRYNDERYSIQRRCCYFDLAKELNKKYNLNKSVIKL